MSQSVNLQEYLLFHKKCKLLLKEPEIRFAGYLDKMGNLMAGGFREDVIPLHDESERRKLHIESVLRISSQEDFDYDLGEIEYLVSRRKKIIAFSFKIDGNVLFVSSEPNVDVDVTAKKIIRICNI